MPAFISSHDYLLSILLLILLILSIFSKHPRRYLVASVALSVFLVLIDQTRLQPWVYQYLIMLTILSAWRPEERDAESARPILAASQLVVAALYFWSGAQKLNWSFAQEVIPALLEPAHINLPSSYLSPIAIAVAVFEMLIGLGLLIPRTRRAAAWLALAMHLAVLSIFIATGRNSAVWPWNIGMITVIALLLWGRDESAVGYVFRRPRALNLADHLPRVAVVICAFLPALSFAGWWDLYLSASLYSGRVPIAVMHIDEGVRDRLPADAREKIFSTVTGELMLPFYEWSLRVLNVPPYPEVRVYRQIASRLCSLTDDQQKNELIIRERPGLSDGSYDVTRIPCAQLRPQYTAANKLFP
jgi:uncharacterized membrane protein YphA (DoxX/SURF4 family)